MTDNRTVGARKPLIFRLGAVRWCLRHALSDGDVADLRRERDISVEHTTVFRWVRRSAPERDRSCLCCVSGRYPTEQTKQQLYQIPTRHHESPIAAPIWLVLCDLVGRGRGARAV